MSLDPSPRGRRLFLSYGHRDATELALRVRSDLEAGGYSVWQDEKRIRAGSAWTDEIRQGLRESDLVIALLSPHAVRRKGWGQNPDDQDSVCLDEIEYAVDACKVPVLPLMAVSCEPPFRIFRLQYFDFRAWQESAARYDDLKTTLLAAVAECLATGRAPLRKWERLPEPWDFTAFLAERRRRFTGRTWLFNTLQDRLAHTTSPAILLTGSPGVGKSAFFASLVYANPAGEILAYHCCQATTPATLSPAVFVRSIAAMIAARDTTFAGMLEHPDTLAALDEARVAKDPASAFENLILNLLHKLPAPESTPRLLVIDGLDEALAWPNSPNSPNLPDLLSARLGAFPAWLKIVATTRDEPPVMRRFRTAELLSLDAAKKDNDEDLRAYVTARLDVEPLYSKASARRQEIADKVLTRGNGNFLVVAQTLDAIESGLFEADDLDTLAPGLHPLYEGFFDRLYKRAGVDFVPSRKLLQCIVAAQEPPLREELAAVVGLDAEADLPPLLGRLASLLPPRDGRYSPFHKTLTEWLTGWNAAEDQPVAGDYYISPKAGHRLWADSFLQRYAKGPAAWDVGLRRHLPTHLVGAGQWTDVADLLLDLRFIEATVRGPGTTVFSLLADFDLALRGFPEVHEKRGLATIRLMGQALHLSAHALARDPDNLLPQLLGRIDTRSELEIASVLTQAAKRRKGPWLCPRTASLARPGGALQQTLEGHTEYVRTVAVTPDGLRAVSGSDDKTLKVWDLDTGQALATLEGHTGVVTTVAVTPDGLRAVSGSHDNTLKVWDLVTGQVLATLEGHTGPVWSVAVTPDGLRAVSASSDNTLKVWNLVTSQVLATLESHTKYVTTVAVTPDGLRAVSASSDNTLKVWDLVTWQEFACFDADRGITVVACPSDVLFVAGSDNGAMHFLELRT